ncbi:hypothetical protein FA15DRAFT_603881 [Coprinopsis marcescibilis]|uniref:Telomerase reverse transcriptase n=1 Tax=Coprinopsis marcescibilis TaxID=230819 RepID=A0A5C3KDU2_COPMA|nr:hypothetical protein FA15DRAFT_603881 [Coprinopsis marcescibilis]
MCLPWAIVWYVRLLPISRFHPNLGLLKLGGKAEGFSVAPSFRNTVVAALRASEWDDLLFRIGVGAMLHLLSETSIFVPLPNGCLCQVTGEPVVFLVPLTKGLLGKTSANPATNIRLLKRPLPLSEAESESGSPPHKRPRLMKPAKFLLPPDVKITK